MIMLILALIILLPLLIVATIMSLINAYKGNMEMFERDYLEGDYDD